MNQDDQNNRSEEFDLHSQSPNGFSNPPPQNTRGLPQTIPTRIFISALCIVVAATVLLTSVITSGVIRRKYINEIASINYQLNLLQDTMDGDAPIGLLLGILEKYSYYDDGLTDEEKIDRVLADYVARTGDRYAAYYTPEEYQSLFAVTEYVGIGITMYQGQIEVDGSTHDGYFIDDYYEGTPAANAGISRGDFIYAVKINGELRSVTECGFELALENLGGDVGTTVEFQVYRQTADGTYESINFKIVCQEIDVITVSGYMKEGSTDTAIVRIDQFDVQTPVEFKQIVNAFLEKGVKNFVFDVRNNPGGDVLSVQAILSFFLQKGDLFMTAQRMDGSSPIEYTVQETSFTGAYRDCSVSADEIGMYADLNCIVLCNENTASAAEIFTSTFRDYGLAPTLGTKTFGKGIIQTIFDLSAWGNYKGYIKLTTYAYVPKCGVSYHGEGIVPDEAVEQSEEALKYHYKDVPQEIDTQLQAAFAKLAS